MKNQTLYLVVFNEDPHARVETSPNSRRPKNLAGACWVLNQADLRALVLYLEPTGQPFLAARSTEEQERGADFESYPYVLIKFDPDLSQLAHADDPRLGCFDAVHHEAFITIARGLYILRNDRKARQLLDELFLATGMIKRGMVRLPFKDGIYCDENTRKLPDMELLHPVASLDEL